MASVKKFGLTDQPNNKPLYTHQVNSIKKMFKARFVYYYKRKLKLIRVTMYTYKPNIIAIMQF